MNNTHTIRVNSFAELKKSGILNGTYSRPNTSVAGTDILSKISTKEAMYPSVMVTPAMAEKLLSLNTANRPISAIKAKEYAEKMTEGKWTFCSNTISISTEMKIQNGQHSLTAVILSGKAQKFNIQTGLSPEAFTVMDIGKTRSGSDTLAVKGFENYSIMAGAIKSIIAYERMGRLRTGSFDRFVSNQEIDEWTKDPVKVDNLSRCIKRIVSLKTHTKGMSLNSANWSFVYYMLSKVNKAMAAEFIDKLSTGEDISRTNHSQIYLLREKLISFNTKSVAFRDVQPKLNLIFKAWNYWRSGQVVTRFYIDGENVLPK